MIDYFLVIVALVYVTVATIFDVKTREVPDWLSFSLIAIAVFSNFLYSLIFNQWNYILYSLIGLAVFFSFGSLMYYARQWGGGDAKLLAGLGALLPQYPILLKNYFNPNLNIPFLLIFIINILVAGGVYGLIYSVVIAARNKKSFLKEFISLINFYKEKMFFLIAFLFMLAALSFFFSLQAIIIPFTFVIIFIIFTFVFIKAVENSSMYKLISVDKLTEGDWVVSINSKIRYKPNPLGVTKQDIAKIKKLKAKKVLVKEGLPFVPAFLIGLIISLIWGNLFLYLV